MRYAAQSRAGFAAILALGAVLRLYGLGRESLWLDEAWTWGIIQGGPADVIDRLRRIDVHPPLYFVLLNLWTGFGAHASEAWLRLFSALCGTGSILLIYRLGRTLGGRRVGLLAAFLLAINSYAIAYSQEARQYALLFLLCLASVNLLVDLRAAHRWWRVAALAMINAAMLLTHYLSVFFVAGEAIAVLLWRRGCRGVVLDVAIAMAGTLALFSPWLPAFLAHGRHVDASFWIPAPTLARVIASLGELIVFRAPRGTYWPAYWIAMAGAAAIWAAALAAPWILRRSDVWAFWALATLPPVAELAVSLRRPIFYAQTFQYVLIPVVVLTAMVLDRLPPLRLQLAVALLSVTMIPALATHVATLGKENWREAEARLAAEVGAGERVVVPVGYNGIALRYYASRAPAPRAWEAGRRLIDSDDLIHPGIPRAAALEEIRREASGVWLVLRYGVDRDWGAVLGERCELRSTWKSRGVELRHCTWSGETRHAPR